MEARSITPVFKHSDWFNSMPEFKTNITRVVDYPAPDGASTRVFECGLPSHVQMPFVSGQFAMIAHQDVRLLANPNLLKWASYSISSSPEQKGLLEFCIGDGTPAGVSHRLMNLKRGEEILVKGAFGKFLLDENAPEYFFLGTGTGVAPLVSMIRTLLHKKKTVPITLFFGFRYPEQFMYREELERLQEKHSNFKAFPIASRPNNGWGFYEGHIQDILQDFSPKRLDKAKVYICGKPEVAEELVQFCLQEKKFVPENVFIEKW